MSRYIPQAVSQADGYKLSHKKFMKDGTTKLYANFTARSGKHAVFEDSEKRTVIAGVQGFIKDVLIGEWNDTFFNVLKADAIGAWSKRVVGYLGEGAVDMAHFEALHDLGYLPLRIKALPEGSKVPFKVAFMTITNTHDDFAWLVTYLETVISCEIWPMVTAATTAYQYLTLCNKFADETVGNRLHVPFQCHDFSNRGLFGRYAAVKSSFGHSLSFLGTDTIAVLDYIEQMYGGYPAGTLIGTSVPASEHSVTSLGIAIDGELATVKRWITEDYQTGIVSVVADTIDYWKMLTEYLPALEPEIRARGPNGFLPGKVVVRPDSGDPVRIICGYRPDEVYTDRWGKLRIRADQPRDEFEITQDEFKGSIRVLHEKFGGSVNAFGFIELDPCIGLIYGDSITLQRAREIFSRLQQAGFASSNVVLGVGSYTYQMVSRDTLGMAIKATYAEVDGEGLELFKDPKTDDGTKKSARGLLVVYEGSDGVIKQSDQVTPEEEEAGLLRTVFEDSELLIDESFITIRNRVQDIKEPEEAVA